MNNQIIIFLPRRKRRGHSEQKEENADTEKRARNLRRKGIKVEKNQIYQQFRRSCRLQDVEVAGQEAGDKINTADWEIKREILTSCIEAI